jgi:threonine dehydratase
VTAATASPGLPVVLDAAERIAGHVRHTPLLTLDAVPGVLLKAEHLQRGGSFKARGATNAMLAHGARQVVTGSSGNHGMAVATLGATLGAHVTVVMARGASPAKADVIRGLGATVVTVDGGNTDRDRHARELARDTDASYVPSADDELVVAGQGTVALEVFAAAPDLVAIFVPTGGGGLLAGSCLAATGPNRRVRVIGVEPATARRYAASLDAGRPVELPPSATIADGLRAQRPGSVPYPIIRDRVDDLLGVTDEATGEAMRLLHSHGVMAEPSGCVALAGALQLRLPGRVAVIVSGGNTAAALAGAVAVRSTVEG